MVKAIDNIRAWAKENVQLITILPENTILKVDTRLKDVLETSVDEKYYLSDEKTALLIAQLEEKDKVAGTIGHHPFSKKFEFSGYNSEISPTLLATDYKAPKTLLEESVTLIDDTQGYDGIRVYKDETPTLRSQRSGLKVLEDVEGLPIKEATKQGYSIAIEGDSVNLQYPNSKTRRGRVGKQMANTLEASGVNQGVVELQQYSDGEGISYNIDANYAKGTSVGDIGKGRRTHVLEKKPEMLEQLHEIMKTARPNQEIQYTFKENGDVSFTLTEQDKHGILIHEENKIKMLGNVFASGGQAGKVYDVSGVSPTVTGQRVNSQGHLLTNEMRIRKLTPRECWRLQGFPDSAFDKAAEVNSNSQLYRQAGNSVTVPVIHEIAKRL